MNDVGPAFPPVVDADTGGCSDEDRDLDGNVDTSEGMPKDILPEEFPQSVSRLSSLLPHGHT